MPDMSMVMGDTLFSPSPEYWSHEEPPVTPPAPAAASSSAATPKSCLSKTVKRRSKASRTKTPTTLLNADSSNFRALVQKFTGCPSNTFSFGAQKGPLNLSFGGQHDHFNYTTLDQTNYYKPSPPSCSSPTPTAVTPIAHKIHHHNNNNCTQYTHQPRAMAAQQPYMQHSSSLNQFGSDEAFLGVEKENVMVVGDGLWVDSLSCSLLDQLLGN